MLHSKFPVTDLVRHQQRDLSASLSSAGQVWCEHGRVTESGERALQHPREDHRADYYDSMIWGDRWKMSQWAESG